MQYLAHFESPLGEIFAVSDGASITGLWFADQTRVHVSRDQTQLRESRPVFDQLDEWLTQYFDGRDPGPIPPVHTAGTPFQERIWAALRAIPYGGTTTYGTLAGQFGRPMSAQAVGGAVGHNPVALLIPCHRVVGSSGSLTGYAGGLWRKEKLLALEAAGKG
ncbi:MAG: methylated-DNA--[protein]-cysteine S-methyltransferase [Clostridiales bacterium]|nr:methylated-DNA--[protein]-cysteine S-methyltransferase [Clostridiales bacterium]